MQNQILNDLQSEIQKTLFFFVQSDLKIYGYITKSTKECFEAQGAIFPEKWLPLLEK